MTVKSVLDIELNAGAFDKFQQQFAKYQQALAKGPKFWRDAAKEQKASVAGFQKMTEAMAAHAGIQRRLTDTYKSQNQHLLQGERLWGSMATHAKGIATSLIGATRSLLSWTGILSAAGGLLGAGSLFGIDRMARSAAESRRGAMGLGLSIGEQRAFQINFGRAVDPDSFLSWISQMETDPSKVGPAAAMGVGLTHRTGADAVSMLRAIRSKALASPNLMGMLPSMYHLEGVSGEDVRRLAAMSNREFEGLVTGYGKDAGKLNIDDSTAEKWTDFIKRLDEAKSSIFKTFVTGLAPLEKPLEHLSSAFETFLNTILRKGGIAETAINTIGDWLEKFSGTLTKPEFLTKLEAFTSDVGTLADTIHDVVHAGDSTAAYLNTLAGLPGGVKVTGAEVNESKSRFLSHLATVEQNSGLPKGMLAYQFQKESGGLLNPPDNKGHVGAFQFDPNTAQWLNRLYHKHLDPRKPGEAAILASYYDDYLIRHYGGDVKKALAAYNWGPENMDAYLKTGRGAKGQSMPQETRDYMTGARVSGTGSNLTVTVNVMTPPGSDLTATASALRH